MANVKNFGLIGVGSDLQFGKAGTRLVNNAGVFNFKAANGSTDVALTAAGITSSSGNVTLTTGNLVASTGNLIASAGNVVLTANSGVVTLGDAGSIGRAATGVYSFSGTGAMIVPSGTTGQQPAHTAGSFRYNSTTALMEYADGTTWTPVGNTAPLQTEINNIETTLGAGIDSSGNLVAASFNGPIVSAASFTDAINQLGAYALAHDTLNEIFPQTGAGNVIYSSGGVWAQAVPGATSGVQAYNAGLDAVSALLDAGGLGIIVQTGVDTVADRSLVAPAAGITISNANGVLGNPTFALANDLAGLEGLTTVGYAVRTGTSTWDTRTMTVVSGDLVITGDANGATTDTTFGLATVSQAATGDFVKVTLDTKGRVTGNTAVTTADITTLVDGTYVNVTGDSMSGNLTFTGGKEVLGLPAVPSGATAATSKAYVDAAVSGLNVHGAVEAATVSALTANYANGSLGVGATLTSTVFAVLPTAAFDGYTGAIVGTRLLVKNQGTTTQNGIYVVTDLGDATPITGHAWVLTRASDYDNSSAGQVHAGDYVFVAEGSTLASTGWTQTSVGTGTGDNTIIGTDPIVFTQFSGAGSYAAGAGLSLDGTVFNAHIATNSGLEFTAPLGQSTIAINYATGAIQAVSSQVALVLDEASAGLSGLTQSASGLKIAAGKVTNAMLTNSYFTVNGDSGTPINLDLGDTYQIVGTSAQGISTAVSVVGPDSRLTITAANASASQKGVASFDATQFSVTAGNVTLGTVPLSALAADSITFTGTSGSDPVVLGESMAIIGADSMITTTMGANSLSIQLATVDVPHGGTGLTSLAAGYIPFGNGTAAFGNTANFTFTEVVGASTVDTLSMGGATGLTLKTDTVSHDVTLTAAGSNGDVVIVPNGSGSLVVGLTGAGLIQSDVGTALTVRGNTTLTLASGTGSTTMVLPSGTGSKVTVSGPTAADYAIGLGNSDLVNKQYVDQAIASGAEAGAIKAVSAVVDLTVASTNIGAVLPAGATVLSVKVSVTAADTGTGTLQVGVTGDGSLMTTTENDTQATGLYMAECYVVEGGSVQVQATTGGTPVSGSATVIVTYQVAV